MGFQIFGKHATVHITTDVTVRRPYTEYVTGDTTCNYTERKNERTKRESMNKRL